MKPCRLLAVLLLALPLSAQVVVDPGPRGGTPDAGGPLASVAANNPFKILDFFLNAEQRFQEIGSVKGTIVGAPDDGLGPRFNALGCARCHAHPAVGGSSPAVNPQVADGKAQGAANVIPSFITSTGVIKEARFVYFTDASGNPVTSQPNGQVMPLFTIAGRTDSGSCTTAFIQQPNFANAVAKNNIAFRIPTPLFGLGLVENIDDSALQMVLTQHYTGPYYVGGTFNRSPNDGTISRFGWKAQNKSLELFAGEAYTVEQGVTNELFTQERPSPEENRDQGPGLAVQCRLNPTPEDHTNLDVPAEDTPSDTVMFALFMRLLKPPVENMGNPATNPNFSRALNGSTIFIDIGCNSCHRDKFTTEPSSITPDLSSKVARLHSDLEIHHMGTGLADNIQQGNAGGDQFRTAPLWGLGKRRWFLHDGRTTNLITAINAHQSPGSDANPVILNWSLLTPTAQQDLIYYLRSL
ncbi:MAG TPA: di-heme oxidoredictase family protein [Thermoanaerobaculia bacterium]|nr:di-heme oxidoredictase family protein [Thermoanaerobaculia bacterium]